MFSAGLQGEQILTSGILGGLTRPGTEMQGFSRYALASAIRLLLKGLPDPMNILCSIVIPVM
jgi:hypothetical protein